MQESYVGTALFTQVSRLHPLLGWNALYSTLWVTVFTHARAVVRYVRFIRPGYSSTINRENTAIQISASHHGLNTMGNRAKKTMNTNQRHLAVRGESLDSLVKFLAYPERRFVNCVHGDGTKSGAAASAGRVLDCPHAMAADGGTSVLPAVEPTAGGAWVRRVCRGQCERFYAEAMGRPSLTPGRYFRLLLIGYFEGI